MSRKIQVVGGLALLALICGLGFWFVAEATVVPMVARGTGPEGVQVTGGGWFALLMSALGTGGFTFASLVAALQKFAEANTTGKTTKVVVDAIDVGALASYATFYKNATDEAEKAKLRDAAQILAQSLFDEWFPTSSAGAKQ